MTAIDKLLENDSFKANTIPMEAPKSKLELPPTTEILSLFMNRANRSNVAMTESITSKQTRSNAGPPVADSTLTRAIKAAAVHFSIQ